MDAFDADVLIYAASPDHPLGDPIRKMFANDSDAPVGCGSVLLLPELFAKPLRNHHDDEAEVLGTMLGRLVLIPTTYEVATLATSYAALHRLRAADAVHLASAVSTGASRFITNNTRDFSAAIDDIEIVTPDRL